MKNQIWILTEVEVTSEIDIDHWSLAYSSESTAIDAMNQRIIDKIKYNEDNHYPEIDIDWRDETGAQLSTKDGTIWTFKIEKRTIN